MRKGLFWVLRENDDYTLLTYSVACNASGERMDADPVYNSRKGNSFSHERSWAEAAKEYPDKIKHKPWDYFPRGRVEAKDSEVTIYFNPALYEWDGFEAAVAQHFDLAAIPILMKPDYSWHYQSKQEQAL